MAWRGSQRSQGTLKKHCEVKNVFIRVKLWGVRIHNAQTLFKEYAMIIKRFDRITQSTEFMSMEEAIGHLRYYWEEESIEPMLMEGRTLWTIYSTYMKAR